MLIITYLTKPLTSFFPLTYTHIYTQTVTWVSVLPKDIWQTLASRIMRKTLMKLVSHVWLEALTPVACRRSSVALALLVLPQRSPADGTRSLRQFHWLDVIL